jgi:dTDP-4-amino-4,6-dideoxygalactose transaminase
MKAIRLPNPAGRTFARTAGELTHTERLSERLVRLPLFAELDEEAVERVIDASRAAAGRAVDASA